MIRYFVLWSVFSFTIFNLSAGSTNTIVIQNFNEKYGLNEGRVNCMCMFQDSKGFLWFGMANGLYKFDLNTLTHFNLQKNKINGFPESDVRAIIEYAPGLLLVGTYNKGLLIYNTVTERFDSVCFNSSFNFSKSYVRCLHLDRTGAIWVGTFNGLFRIKYLGKQTNKFELVNRFDHSNVNLVGSEFVSIMESKNGIVWFLTMSDIGCFNTSTKKIKIFPTWGANSSFTFIDDKRILIGCFATGLKIFNIETSRCENIRIKGLTEKSQIRYVHKDSQANIWLSISNVGLMLLGPDLENPQITLISNKDPKYSDLNSNVIYRIGESRDGALWICNEEGINMLYLKKNFFQSYSCNIFDHNTELAIGIRSLLNSENGFIWTGTIGGGLKQFDLASRKFTDVSLVYEGKEIGKNIQAIMRDHQGNLWLGTEGEGVIKFMPEKISGYTRGRTMVYRIYPVSFPARGLLNDYVMYLLEDRHNNIWIGTWHGLSLIESSELEKPDQSKAIIKNFLNNPSDKFSISNNIVMSLFEDKAGDIWAGTQEGLNRIIKTSKGYKFEHNYKNNDGILLSEKKILVSYQNKKGTLWFSTQDGGIDWLNTKTGIFEEYNSDNGFQDNIITSISEDSFGNLWLGSNNGLCRFDPLGRSFNNYTIEDGLVSNDFLFASTCKVGNNLYFGGNRSLTVFDPKEIMPSTFKPNLVFTGFRLFNKPVNINTKGSPLKEHISFVKSLTLNYNQNFITLAFAALNYNQQKEIQYSCMMEGLETSWNNLGKETKITYTNLVPGRYMFRVKAYNSNDSNNASHISLEILVKPPFWKTLWAYMVYLVLITFALIRIYVFFLNKEKRKNSLALERMNAKRIHEMDLMRLQFFTNISHEFRTPLTLLSAPLESLIQEKPDPAKAQSYYQLMLKNVQRLTRLINQLLDLRKIEEGYLKMEWKQGDIIEFVQKTVNSFQNYAEKRNIYFTFQSGRSQLFTFFDADKLDKVLFNLLSNAFKYTPDYGSVSLKMNEIEPGLMPYPGLKERYLEIKLSDSGIGIPKDAIEKIFNPFQQVNRNKPIGSAATGIGLSLTKELVDLHQGFITVESEINAGSTFTVYLPVYKNNPQKDNLASNNNENPDGLVNEEAPGSVEQEKNLQLRSSTSKPLVLIVDDSSDLRTFLSDELGESYRIIEAANGQDGLDQAITKIPDLVVSDIMMDKMDGVELCGKLKLDERTSHIPIILLTARHSEDIKLNSYEIGADDYITKPFSTNLLIFRIKNLIEQRRKLRTLFGKGINFDPSTIATNKIDSQFVEKLIQDIEKNMENPDFDPSMLASNMAMSRMQLYRKVAALTNQTVYNLIRTVRLNKAAQLLITTDMQIAEIAFSVGYNEPSNFTKNFIRQFNQTPSQFVRSNRK
jgi:signal transduction histidine kinase/ligand-binding sensor domain-containing protein/DNA-binding response OmpR family regulator